MSRVYNFSAGPATLPEEVLQQAADEMLDWHGSGQSVMEMSHRGKEFISIAEAAEADLRALLAIPDHYRVLFLQGGATLQFEMVPMNLLRGKSSSDYVHTGEWAKKAIKAGQGFGGVNIAASAEDRGFTYVPDPATWQRNEDAAYLHYTANETIGGVEFFFVPDTGDVPLVSDMSSNLLSRPVDVSRFGLIYAGAQKNIGPAGLTIVIIRDDLVGIGQPTPSLMLDYATHVKADSMHNTPPTYAVYIAGLVFRRLLETGGLAAAEERNIAKATAALRVSGQRRLLRQPGGGGRPVADERAVHLGRPGSGRRLPGRSGRAWAGAAQGPSLGGRDAGLALQRDADRRRPGADRLHGRLRAEPGLSDHDREVPGAGAEPHLGPRPETAALGPVRGLGRGGRPARDAGPVGRSAPA